MATPRKPRPMSDQEIVREYLDAKNPGRQIRILADENLCSPDTIRNILRREGVLVARREPEAKPEPAPAPAPEMPEEEQIGRDTALSLLVRHAAVETVARLLEACDASTAEGCELELREQIRGVLALVHTLEEDDEDDA